MRLFLVFVKIGSVLFGSGYVLFAFLRTDLVERLHWLSEAQLVDAVAVGQLTPGPLFTTATFVGYLPARRSRRRGGRVRWASSCPRSCSSPRAGHSCHGSAQHAAAGAFLDGLNVASLALMAVVTLQLGAATLRGPVPVALAGISLALLARYSVNPTWLVALGAAVGWLFAPSL